MRLFERIRKTREIMASAREAAAAGKSQEEWLSEQAEAAGPDWGKLLEIILTLLPIILTFFNKGE